MSKLRAYLERCRGVLMEYRKLHERVTSSDCIRRDIAQCRDMLTDAMLVLESNLTDEQKKDLIRGLRDKSEEAIKRMESVRCRGQSG